LWTDEEIKRTVELYKNKMPYIEIAKRLNEEFHNNKDIRKLISVGYALKLAVKRGKYGLTKDDLKKRSKGFNNKYKIRKDGCVEIYLKRKNEEDMISIIDLDDLQKLIDFNYTWCASYNKSNNSWYAHCIIYKNGTMKKLALQCFIMNLIERKRGQYVDHINNDTLDNRKENLRIIDNSSNLRNRKGKNKNNSSGYRNVTFNKSTGKWLVQLQINGKNTRLGEFEDVHEAGKYAEKMRKIYYGNYAGNS